MSIQQSLNTALTTSAALYTQSAGSKARQIQKPGKFAEAKEEEFSKKFSKISPKIVKTQLNLEKQKQRQEELKEDLKEFEGIDKETKKKYEKWQKIEDEGYKIKHGLSAEEIIEGWKKQAASNIKRAQTAYFKAKNELDELTFKRNLYRNLYGGAR